MTHKPEFTETTTSMDRGEPGRIAATVMGAVFLLVGVLGFIPGITTHLDELTFAGPRSGAMLLGLFCVSVLHNLVHLALGLAGLVLARTPRGARIFLVGGGVLYLLLWVYGLVVDEDSAANVVPVNAADNWLHLVLAVLMPALAFLVGTPRKPTNTPMHAPN